MDRGMTKTQDGATLIEYVLLIGLIALAAIIAVSTFSGSVQNKFNDASNSIILAGDSGGESQ